MHRYTAVCLAGAFCFLICGSRAEASNLLPAADEGIASVMTEAREVETSMSGPASRVNNRGLLRDVAPHTVRCGAAHPSK